MEVDMRLQMIVTAITLVLAAGPAAAQTRPDEEPMAVAEIAKSAAWSVHDNATALLARTDLSEADRKEIAAILQRAEAAAEKLAREAGDQAVDPKITRDALAKLQQQYAAPVNGEYKKFTRSRGDLDWMSSRAAGIQSVEDPAIIARTKEYLDTAEDAGIDTARRQTIGKILDDTRTQWDKDKQLMQAAFVVNPDAAARRKLLMSYDGIQVATLAKARAAIRASLTPPQVAALEWQFLQKFRDIPDYAKLGFSTQAQTWSAPEDGVYVLESYPDRKELSKVTLKKGATMGFRKKDNVVKALAGDKEVDLPAGMTYWMKVEE
jgi:hypothetical protein